MFDVMFFPAFVRASDIISSILSKHLLGKPSEHHVIKVHFVCRLRLVNELVLVDSLAGSFRPSVVMLKTTNCMPQYAQL